MIAATDIRATERVIWSAEARAELFWRFFILFFLAVQPAVSTQKSTEAFHVSERFAQERRQMSRIFLKI
jgi:3-methyladenine DNA glycosylase AlkD